MDRGRYFAGLLRNLISSKPRQRSRRLPKVNDLGFGETLSGQAGIED
jgi:hypothetical protein